GGRCERGVGAHVEVGVDVAVHLGDPVQVRAGDLLRRRLTGGHRRGELGGTRPDQVAHASSPRICGTAKRPSSAAGACASASAWSSVGPTTSSRNTFDSGNGWLVAGTSDETASLTVAMAETI